jgi:hypothetical protein
MGTPDRCGTGATVVDRRDAFKRWSASEAHSTMRYVQFN